MRTPIRLVASLLAVVIAPSAGTDGDHLVSYGPRQAAAPNKGLARHRD
jgi:hypothetical protein